MLENGFINRFQLSLLMINFLIGSALLFVPGKVIETTKQDAWISMLLVTVIGSLFMILTVTLTIKNNNQTVVGISNSLLGRPLGLIIGLTYAWFYLHLAAILLRELGDMLKVTQFSVTPMLFINTLIGILVLYLTYSGLEVIARFNEFITPVAIIGFWLSIFLVIPLMKIENILPVLSQGYSPIGQGAFPVIGFTFAELSIFLMVIPFLSNHKNIMKITIFAGIIASLSLTTIVITTILVLGVKEAELSIFAPFNVVRLINIGDFLTRLEAIMALTYIFTVLIKMTLSFYAGVLALAEVFNLSDYRPIITPLIVIIISLSFILTESIIEFLHFTSTAWTPYALIFGLLFPLALLSITFIKKRNSRKN